MKRILLIALILQLSISSYGQKIHFTDTSNKWSVLVTYVNTTSVLTQLETYSYSYSVLVDSVEYKVLGTYYVREDTDAKIVYIRYHDVNHGLVDTEDRVLYDYNWKVNDTVVSNQYFGHYKSWVTEIDSTKIDGIWYKVWHFLGGKDTANGLIFYNVIEGIGCTNMFDYPVNTPLPDGSNQLVCFTNNGLGSHLSVPVQSYGMFFISTLYFDNSVNCPLSAEEITKNNRKAILYPNPVNEHTKIVLPYGIQYGNFSLYSYTGQAIANESFTDKKEIPIETIRLTPGIYFYKVSDKETGKIFSGKFSY